jgi:nucleoporin NUP2
VEGGEEETVKLLPSHTHDEEGEGEEDEETMHAVRCKVFRLFKSEDKSEWKDLGVGSSSPLSPESASMYRPSPTGMFRLKKHKETNARRVLMRNSNTGRILVNFRIHGNLKPSLAKNAVSFVGYETSTPTSFSIRTKTAEQAEDLKRALEREIAAAHAAE